jgi:tRNA(Met) cytidine acetyltransferase
VFARAAEALADLGEPDAGEAGEPRLLETADGRVRFEPPDSAVELPNDPDLVIVDEAAALPVARLAAVLEAPAAAFATTVHGYEGAGRGFDVRFREHLAGHGHREVSLRTPIRYAAGDPVEVWAFRALALDARPPVGPVVEDADPGTVTYCRPTGADLVADEVFLREAFGLLVRAHYRTEPDDLARLLDAPNVSVRALVHGGHPAAVALLAREGDLPADLRARAYEGGRIRGHMLPDVLTSQLRDERAGIPAGWRVLRIATHAGVRSQGLGSALLAAVRTEARDRGLDYLGVGYGLTPDLARFWGANGFRTVHLSTSRNDRSGEHSAVMVDPLTDAGRRLHDRHADWFRRRVAGTLADPLADADPDAVRAALRTVAGEPELDLSLPEWRVVVGADEGAAIYDTAPRPFRRLALRHLIAPADPDALAPRAERLLVRKTLQARPWATVADELGYDSPAACKRALGSAAGRLADLYGGEPVREERDRL